MGIIDERMNERNEIKGTLLVLLFLFFGFFGVVFVSTPRVHGVGLVYCVVG